jgi:hypothetical protein
MRVSPPISFFEGDCFIGHSYENKVKFLKISDGDVKYRVRLEGKNDPDLKVDLRSGGQSLSNTEGGVMEGVIQGSAGEIEFEMSMESPNCGEKNAYFFIEIEDGEPLSFQCMATFRGPIVKLTEPVCDYQLVKINTEQEYKITLENQSPIPARIMIKSSRNKKVLSFESILSKIEEGADLTEFAFAKTFGGNMMKIEPFF